MGGGAAAASSLPLMRKTTDLDFGGGRVCAGRGARVSLLVRADWFGEWSTVEATSVSVSSQSSSDPKSGRAGTGGGGSLAAMPLSFVRKTADLDFVSGRVPAGRGASASLLVPADWISDLFDVEAVSSCHLKSDREMMGTRGTVGTVAFDAPRRIPSKALKEERLRGLTGAKSTPALAHAPAPGPAATALVGLCAETVDSGYQALSYASGDIGGMRYESLRVASDSFE
ncbi:hypothetical protein K438DRAFT_1831081 [Mycena galopus ATCC 62051]|nr:hypothetical protein K438DRAFT_1831081 [Mycena galopus ATCC 62051]